MWKLVFFSTPIIFYLVMAYLLWRKWRFFFVRDETMSFQERTVSQILLLMATICWPIIVPFAYLELLNGKIKSQKEIELLERQDKDSHDSEKEKFKR